MTKQPKPNLKQTTLDGTPYCELNRLGQPTVRWPKAHPYDYVLLVSGSRSIKDEAWVKRQLDRFVHKKKRDLLPVRLIHGDAPGVDEAAAKWAAGKNIPTDALSIHPLYAKKWPRREFGWLAYEKRDYDLVDLADLVVTLWDGSSGGTRRVKEYALSQGKFIYGAEYLGATEKQEEEDNCLDDEN